MNATLLALLIAVQVPQTGTLAPAASGSTTEYGPNGSVGGSIGVRPPQPPADHASSEPSPNVANASLVPERMSTPRSKIR